jgi:hypothetical protein
LLKVDKYLKAIASGEDIIIVYMDELYVDTIHLVRCPYVPKGDSSINKSSSKGQRLIILHTISDKGPLCERIKDIHVDNLDWNGDTPHPGAQEDGSKVACFGKVTPCVVEMLWLATSKAGDYHNHMTSNMFMQWAC